jgi:hypothetical protein
MHGHRFSARATLHRKQLTLAAIQLTTWITVMGLINQHRALQNNMSDAQANPAPYNYYLPELVAMLLPRHK